MIWHAINYLIEKLNIFSGIKRLIILIIAPFILAILLFIAEYGFIELFTYFEIMPEKASPFWFYIFFIINTILSYSLVLYNIIVDNEYMVVLKHDRSKLDLRFFLSQAKKNINLIGLSLKPFATENVINEMKSLIITSDVKIKILLLNPFTVAASIRSDSLYPGKSKLTTRISDAIIEFSDLAQFLRINNFAKSNNFEVKVYSNWPTTSMFIVDGIVNFSNYFENKTGLNSPYFIIKKNSKNQLFEVVQNHFDAIWASGISILENDWINKAKVCALDQIKSIDKPSIFEDKLRMWDESN